MGQGLNLRTQYLPKAGALPDCATPRMAETPCVSLGFLICREERSKSKNGGFGLGGRFNVTKRHQKRHQISPFVLAAGLALAFDPHVLLLSWSADHQETVAATSLRTCEAARDAIAAGRWLAEDPPAAMRCERGSGFAPGADCIEGYNCGTRR